MAKPNKGKTRNVKRSIYIFCEGETEVEYANFLKERFGKVVAIQKPVKCTFDKAWSNFNNSPKYTNKIEETDEIWFFFDVDAEQGDKQKWSDRVVIIKNLRALRKKPNIQIRLLMTTGCIEYWLCLHYERFSPSITTSADKETLLKRVVSKVPSYKKGDKSSIYSIAKEYKTAIENGDWSIQQLRLDSQPKGNKEDDISEWLYKNTKTFTNVHEAIRYLESL